MDYKQITQEIDKKIFYPIYLLSGEEPYYIDLISDHIEERALTEEEKGFNQTIVYGKDSDVESIIQMAKRYPMMSNHQVIIIKEAQELKNVEHLHYYAQNPLPSTILVICYKYKKFPKTTKLAKLVQSKGLIFDSARIPNYKIDSWIVNFVKEKSYKIDTSTAILLGEHLGSQLHKIVNELSKLMSILPKNSIITKDNIEKNIGISKDYNVFELSNAFGEKNVLKVNRILNYFAVNSKDNRAPAIIASLYSYFQKILLLYFITDKSNTAISQTLGISPTPFIINQYKAAQKRYSAQKLTKIISILRIYDMKFKGVNASSSSQGDLLKEMAFKILH
ncbi:MAG: DNA polymerase III subunit delta [Bacteroidales bacterium]|nr:DNA polymerase III subunit delta [Bacteroidales bacterium]